MSMCIYCSFATTVSQHSSVTTQQCHNTAVSQHSSVTTQKCHNTTVSQHSSVTTQQCHNSKCVIFQEKRLKVLKCCNFLWVQRRHNCSPAASFENCVMTLYPLKVHLRMFLSIPITQKCQIFSCDSLFANERYVLRCAWKYMWNPYYQTRLFLFLLNSAEQFFLLTCHVDKELSFICTLIQTSLS